MIVLQLNVPPPQSKLKYALLHGTSLGDSPFKKEKLKLSRYSQSTCRPQESQDELACLLHQSIHTLSPKKAAEGARSERLACNLQRRRAVSNRLARRQFQGVRRLVQLPKIGSFELDGWQGSKAI